MASIWSRVRTKVESLEKTLTVDIRRFNLTDITDVLKEILVVVEALESGGVATATKAVEALESGGVATATKAVEALESGGVATVVKSIGAELGGTPESSTYLKIT